ncbi:hypothetical protein [Acinetobacter phage P1068]|nr:hypothetical protein [Acinetobacter phage P1068]
MTINIYQRGLSALFYLTKDLLCIKFYIKYHVNRRKK